jgi:hypothetical protein
VRKEIHEKNIEIIGEGPDISAWTPTWVMYKIYFYNLIRISYCAIKCLFVDHSISLYYIFSLLKLARDYAYWYDFFEANNIKLNISTSTATTVGQVLALDSLNGLSISYQYSISNIYPTTFISSGENVQFVFSDLFKTIWQTVDAPVDQYIKTGFVHDSSVQTLPYSERILKTRAQLMENGAQFIICFFDENSIDRWDMPVPHIRAAEDYEFLLRWLFNNDTIGIVFKPKRSHDLFERLSSIADLIGPARDTGRCVFLTSNTTVGSIYPAEAALISDLCIGKLTGATAAFEAQLSGVPTLLIDAEGFDWHPFYEWGEGQIIFDNWETLRQRVEAYCLNPKGIPELGDWSPGRKYLDPFSDNRATQRMGAYIQWLLNAITEGQPKNVAMKIAAEKYADLWGKEHISCVV